MDLFVQAAQLSPNDAQLQNNLGQAHRALGDPSAATLAFRCAAERGVPCLTVDPGPPPETHYIAAVDQEGYVTNVPVPIHHLKAKSEELLPEVLRLLQA